MLDIVEAAIPAASALRAASDVLGRDPFALLRSGGEQDLFVNRTSQVLCVTRAVAVAAALAPLPSLNIAGYSIGELSAWSIAGLWFAGDAIRLAARRAELMDAADPEDGGLGFVRGLDRSAAEMLFESFGCTTAIINPDRLLVFGGRRDAVAACCAAAMALGAMAARPIMVNIAAHTPRLAQAVAPFEAAVRATPSSLPRHDRALIGADGARLISSSGAGAAGLAGQLAKTVDWAGVLEALVERGTRQVLELGPGDGLAQMARASYPFLRVRAVDDFRSLEGVRSWLSG